MVDSINSTTGTNFRAQQIANTANVSSTRAAAQTIINQTRSSAVVTVRATSVPQTTKLANSSNAPPPSLPRGSIIDTLV